MADLCIICGKNVKEVHDDLPNYNSPVVGLQIITWIRTEKGRYPVCFNCFTFKPKEEIQNKIRELESKRD